MKDWFSATEIDVMEWPAYSPDLNPIENIWGVLARKVYKSGRQFETVSSLVDCIKSSWAEIDLSTINSVIQSMPKRCLKVIQAKGGRIKY